MELELVANLTLLILEYEKSQTFILFWLVTKLFLVSIPHILGGRDKKEKFCVSWAKLF